MKWKIIFMLIGTLLAFLIATGKIDLKLCSIFCVIAPATVAGLLLIMAYLDDFFEKKKKT